MSCLLLSRLLLCVVFCLQLLRRHELPAPSASQAMLEVLELFDDMLLLKQPLGPLRIYNVSNAHALYNPFSPAVVLLCLLALQQQCSTQLTASVSCFVEARHLLCNVITSAVHAAVVRLIHC
jgi:hypothetical protein